VVSVSGGGEIWQSLGKFQTQHWDQLEISKFKNYKITFHKGVAIFFSEDIARRLSTYLGSFTGKR